MRTGTDPATLLNARDIGGLMEVARLLVSCAETPEAFERAAARLAGVVAQVKPKYLPGLGLLEDLLPHPSADGAVAPGGLRSLGLTEDDVYFRLAGLLPEGPEPDPGSPAEVLVRRRLLSILEPTVLGAMERRLAALQGRISAETWKSCLDTFEDGVVSVARDGKVVYQNPRAAALFDLRSPAQPCAVKLRALVQRFAGGAVPAPGWLPVESCRGETGEVELHAVVPPAPRGGGTAPVMHVFLVERRALPLEGDVRADAFPELSERERQVLSGLLEGRTLGAIAAALEVSEATTRTYRDRIYEKLGVSSRRALLLAALRPRRSPPPAAPPRSSRG